MFYISPGSKDLEETEYSSLAQSVEHLTVNQGVTGSSPVGGAKTKPEAIASGFVLLPPPGLDRQRAHGLP